MSRFREMRQRMPSLLVLALGGAAAALSWDALRSVALTTGAVHHTVMAGVWAVTIDLLWIACMRAAARAMPGRRGWALAGLVVGVCFSGFQVFTPWTWLARMVPVTALLVAWMLDSFVVSKHIGTAPARIVEVNDGVRTGPEPAHGSVPTGRLGAGVAARSVGSATEDADPVHRDTVHLEHTAGPAQRHPAVEGPPVGRATVAGVGSDGVAHDRTGKMTIPEAVRYLIEVDGADPHGVTPARIMDRMRELTGRQVINTGSVGNELSKARKNAPSNGGMKVRT